MLRDAACVDSAEPAGVYFGTRGGTVYASADEGETFAEVVSHLPDVCVSAPPSSRGRGCRSRAFRKRRRPRVPDIRVVLPSILQPLAGGQSVLTAPADGPVTVGKLLDSVTGGSRCWPGGCGTKPARCAAS